MRGFSTAFLFLLLLIDGQQSPSQFDPLKLFKLIKKKNIQTKHINYRHTVKGVSYDMVFIKKGRFYFGSDKAEKGRKEDEGPQLFVQVDDFWILKTEVSWDLFLLWRDQFRYSENEKDSSKNIEDMVSKATPPYVNMDFGMGKKNKPAVGMTQFAAKVFCMWLSAKTGHFYRLATEAEWEYACKAGNNEKYFFGNNQKKLKDYAVFIDNSSGVYSPLMSKKPNNWGLYDMLGNVAEWTLDSYQNSHIGLSNNNPIRLRKRDKGENPIEEAFWPYVMYNIVIKGGSFRDKASNVRPSSRSFSVSALKNLDPQIPKSVWYLTNASFLGFRFVRPAKLPSENDLYKYWPTKEEIESIPVD